MKSVAALITPYPARKINPPARRRAASPRDEVTQIHRDPHATAASADPKTPPRLPGAAPPAREHGLPCSGHGGFRRARSLPAGRTCHCARRCVLRISLRAARSGCHARRGTGRVGGRRVRPLRAIAPRRCAHPRAGHRTTRAAAAPCCPGGTIFTRLTRRPR